VDHGVEILCLPWDSFLVPMILSIKEKPPPTKSEKIIKKYCSKQPEIINRKFIRYPVKHNKTQKLTEGWKHKGNIDPK
jgi:hypothetical protein